MSESENEQSWPKLFRLYLALREHGNLAAALACAPPEVAEFLEACRGRSSEAVFEKARSLREQLSSEREAALTVELGCCDPFAQLCQAYVYYPPNRRDEALQRGIAGCRDAISLAEALEDLPCAAFYGGVLASGLQASGDLDASIAAHRASEDIYRGLAKDRPEIYLHELAKSLNNKATVLQELRGWNAAREALSEALAIRRSLADIRPEIYVDYVASTLLNLGNAARCLHEPLAARDAWSEALGIYRDLEDKRPGEFLPDVAKTLHNLGSLLSELGEWQAAYEACSQAVATFRRLAEHRSGSYQRDVAYTLNGLGNLLRELGEHEQAFNAYSEAVKIYTDLDGERPGSHLQSVGMTLHNLGNILTDLRRLEEARDAYSRSVVIRARLAEEQPRVHLPDLAATMHNLGNLLQDLGELEEARSLLSQALNIGRHVAEGRPEPSLAGTLNDLGRVLADLREFEAAQEAYLEALAIRRRLANDQAQIHMADLATTLNNLGVLMVQRREEQAALVGLSEALAIRRHLAEKAPAVYLGDLAMTLTNLGALLIGLRLWDEARDALSEALTIRRSLVKHAPYLLADIARTLNNMGRLHQDLLDLDHAREAYAESVGLYAQANCPLDAALPCANRAWLERECGDRSFAAEWAVRSIEFIEIGIAQLSTSDHYDKFKARIEEAVEVLVELYAEEGPQAFGKLLRLFEWLRLVEGTAGLRESAPPILPGSLTAPILWIQRVRRSLIFALVRPGEEVRIFQKKDTMEDGALVGLIINLIRWLHDGWESRPITDAAKPLFELFPEEIRRLLCEEDGHPVFVSPCRRTLTLPLELIPALDGDDTKPFAGLRKLIVRFHSVNELDAVIKRNVHLDQMPPVVVGEPMTSQAVPLPAARRGAEYAGHLFGTTAILGEDATRDRVIGQLSNPLLSLFIFMGHGDLHELLLAGEDRFGLKDLASINWQNAPFIHLDCCHTGIVQGALGGRFIGMPSAMIRCGAGAVLASYYPLYDQPAMIFSRTLYDLMMKEKRMVGEALLQVRCKMHELFGGVPLYWATSILWGNPNIRLTRD